MFATKFICAVVILTMTSRWCVSLPPPSGVNFIGIGYDIINGNPEGGDLASGGVDPGLKVSRNIFKLTYDNGQTSNDGEFTIPDETTFDHRSSSSSETRVTTFYGTKSYQEKLSVGVSVSGEMQFRFLLRF